MSVGDPRIRHQKNYARDELLACARSAEPFPDPFRATDRLRAEQRTVYGPSTNGSIAFHAVPIRIANVQRKVSDRIVVLRAGVPGRRLQARCHVARLPVGESSPTFTQPNNQQSFLSGDFRVRSVTGSKQRSVAHQEVFTHDP